MDMKPVKSSNLKAIGYDPATQTLAVQFANGGTYHYTGVSPEAHDGLLKAKSVGHHFFHEIRSKFESKKQ